MNFQQPRQRGVTPQQLYAAYNAVARQLTVDDTASPFGCCNFFDHCADEIFNLSMAGALDLLDWMGFVPTEDCYRSVEFINYVRPEQTGGACTVGYLSDPCADPHGFEFGECAITVQDFGLLGREGPTREVLKPKKWCKTYPTYRLDGSLVTSEIEWDALMTMGTLLDDVRRMLVTGNAATAGQFDGLQQWVATGYECAMLDSIVIDWNQNGMGGGAGVTWNGNAVGAGFDLVDVLLAAHRQVYDRLSWAPFFRNQMMRGVDMIIVAPSFLNRCLLDEYACWSVCANTSTGVTMTNDAKAIRESRLTLDGGRFGHGHIMLDDHDISLLNYDWELINSQNTGDMYLLTGQVGSQRIWEGEFLNAATNLADLAGALGGGADDFFTMDGGRVIGKKDYDNLCYEIKLWMALRLFCLAPWAQVRFQDVACAHPQPLISPDPCDTCFYPETCFSAAECD